MTPVANAGSRKQKQEPVFLAYGFGLPGYGAYLKSPLDGLNQSRQNLTYFGDFVP